VPVTFFLNERASGGRLPVETPFAAGGRVAVAALSDLLLVAGVGLVFELSCATRLWPFAITPIVARILGVWLGCLGLAHTWAAWDGDRLRALRQPSSGLPRPFEGTSLVRGTWSVRPLGKRLNPSLSAAASRPVIPRTRDYDEDGVTRYASKTASMLRTAFSSERSAFTS